MTMTVFYSACPKLVDIFGQHFMTQHGIIVLSL